MSMTETGTCIRCGATNIRSVHGTRLQPVYELHLSILMPSGENNKFPIIKSEWENVTVTDIVWENSGGIELSGLNSNTTIKTGDTYQLTKLTLKVNDGYRLNADVSLYVNGALFNGQAVIEDGEITFENVGQIEL